MSPSEVSSPKVVHVVAGGGIGGAEIFCLDLIKALHERGIKQHVITRNYQNYIEAFKQRDIPYDIITFNPWLKFFERLKIKKIIQRRNPAIVHSWMGRASSFMPRGLTMPILGWFGGYYDLKRYKNCNFYAGVTRDLVRHISEKSGTPERVFLTHTFGTLEDQAPVNRADLHTPDNVPVVLLLSRMHWKKGVDTLLHAATRVSNAYFWLAGDGPEIKIYQALAEKLNLQDRVRFLGWRDDRSALLKSVTVCVLPSRYEPFGTVIAESWYAGVPLVAAKAAGASQYVTHDKDGLLCEIDDAEGLARELQRAIDDQALRSTLIANGKATYDALFSKQVVVDAMLACYETVIKTHKTESLETVFSRA